MTRLFWSRCSWCQHAVIVAGLLLPGTADAQQGWGPTDLVSGVVTGVYGHALAVDQAGTTTAAWLELLPDSTYFRLKASRRAGGGGWGTPNTISSPVRDADLALAASAAGDVVALWVAESAIFASRYSAGTGAWTPETVVGARQYAHGPSLAIDAVGNAIAMWYLDGIERVEGARYDAASATWGPVRDFGSGVMPLVGMDGAGNALAVWSFLGVTTSIVYFSRYVAATGQWSAPGIVQSAAFAGAAELGVDADGTAALLMATADAAVTNYAVRVAFYSATAGTWGPAAEVTTSFVNDAALALGRADAVVVWADQQGVVARHYDRTGAAGWSPATVIDPATTDDVHLAADALGGVVATWTADERVRGSHFAHSTGGWSPAAPLSLPGLRAYAPEVVMAPTGSATVTWIASQFPVMAVQSSQWRATLLPPTVVGLTAAGGSLSLAFTPMAQALAELAPQNVEYSTDDGATWTPRSPASAASPVVITGLTDFTPYRVSVRYLNVAGAGVASAPLAAKPGVGSTVPTDLVATAIRGNTVTVAWAQPAVGAVPVGYVLEGGLVPGEVLGTIPMGSTASRFTFAAPTGRFFVRVHAIVPLPPGRTGASNEIRLVVNVPEPPSPPRDLRGLANGSSIALSWANSFEGGAPTGVVLMADGPPGNLSLPLGLTESFQFAGVPPGTYMLQLIATNAAGASTPSNIVTLTFPSACSGVPGPPTHLAVEPAGRTLSVSWGPPETGAAATSYVLHVGGAFVGSIPLTAREISGTVPPGDYTFSVTAANACGTSAPGPVVTVAVP